MPVTNLGRLHLTTAQKTAIDAALTAIETQLLTVTMNLNAEKNVISLVVLKSTISCL